MPCRFDITGLGFCSWDYAVAIPRIPADGKVEIVSRASQGGGPAATATYAAQRLGARTAFIGTTGDDQCGRDIFHEFRECGVDASGLVSRNGALAAVAFCWAELETGQRSIAWSRGTAAPLRAEEVAFDIVRSSRALHLDGHQTAAALAAIDAAKAEGAIVCLDAGTLLPDIDALLRQCDIVIASESFARVFTGESEPQAALRQIHKSGPRWVIVTQGERGSLGYDGNQVVRVPAFPVRVVDSTGAGDVYHGAFLYRHLAGGDMAESMRFASAAAAMKCTALGGRAGIPTPTALEQFIRQHQRQNGD
jgi:sugar/nucleoside kinase (ribokinase family)